ncbi:MAG: hypothetical protein ACXVSF_22715 [Solirubrobacteraceae bacterium]
MSGIRRQVGTDQLRRAAPLELEPLELVLAPIDTATLAGQRDRALLLLGFAAALSSPTPCLLVDVDFGRCEARHSGISRRSARRKRPQRSLRRRR